VDSTVALAQVLGVHRQTIDDWRLKGMPTLSVTRNGTGEICTYDLKTVVEWRYGAEVAAGIEESKGKAKGTAGFP
jgi:phage terminase Nu1 subunit (DNA packaging protein)